MKKLFGQKCNFFTDFWYVGVFEFLGQISIWNSFKGENHLFFPITVDYKKVT